MHQSTEVGEGRHIQLLSSVEEVRQVEVLDVVAGDNVRINLLDKTGPVLWNERKVSLNEQ